MRYRKVVAFRHQCFVAGVVAADYRNSHRQSESDRIFSPLDYVTCEEMTKEEIEAQQREDNERAVQALKSMGVKEKVSN